MFKLLLYENLLFYVFGNIKFIKQFIIAIKIKTIDKIDWMSKLYKTTYSTRQPNLNNFLNSAGGSREVTK